jgi:hypothetical protein
MAITAAQTLSIFGPIGYFAAVSWSVVWFGRFLDKNLKPATKRAVTNYLKQGGIRDSSQALVDAASETISHVFGDRHFSLRCFFVSILFTLTFNILFIALTAIIHLIIGQFNYTNVNSFLLEYWATTLKIGFRGFITWIIWSVLIDYISLFKTRVLLKLLKRYMYLAPILCLIDFLIGFAIYTAGISLLIVLPLFVHSDNIPSPVFSLEMAFLLLFIVDLYYMISLPTPEAFFAATGQHPTPQMLAFTHSNASETMIAALFLVQLIPFATIGSDLFYASMIPSIWLWIFFASVIAFRIGVHLSEYIQFTFSYFKSNDTPLELTSRALVPIIIFLLFVFSFWPYLIAIMIFVLTIILGAIRLLIEHASNVIKS